MRGDVVVVWLEVYKTYGCFAAVAALLGSFSLLVVVFVVVLWFTSLVSCPSVVWGNVLLIVWALAGVGGVFFDGGYWRYSFKLLPPTLFAYSLVVVTVWLARCFLNFPRSRGSSGGGITPLRGPSARVRPFVLFKLALLFAVAIFAWVVIVHVAFALNREAAFVVCALSFIVFFFCGWALL